MVRVASLLLVHGAGSGPWVFGRWQGAFPGLEVRAADLQAGADVYRVSMTDYAHTVIRVSRALPPQIVLLGWSMGGLVALMAAEAIQPALVVLLEPSPPAEVQGHDLHMHLREGLFDPQKIYGRFPQGVPARPESQLARDERKRGISVPSLPCPSLVLWGDDFGDERGRRVAQLYGSREMYVPGATHWDLVLDAKIPMRIGDTLAGREQK
jgi:pimeloyl-ACP methyl ester carboxylesterase